MNGIIAYIAKTENTHYQPLNKEAYQYIAALDPGKMTAGYEAYNAKMQDMHERNAKQGISFHLMTKIVEYYSEEDLVKIKYDISKLPNFVSFDMSLDNYPIV